MRPPAGSATASTPIAPALKVLAEDTAIPADGWWIYVEVADAATADRIMAAGAHEMGFW